jgi:hypothetical protein
MRIATACAIAGLFAGLVGCVTEATVDLTRAPFAASTDLTEAPLRASTELTNGVSQATSDLTEPTREFTSSTTPGAIFTGDGLVKSDARVLALAAYNFENLRRDMAQGHGEYLASLATLLDVPAAQQPAFFELAQERYPVIYAAGMEPRDSYRTLLRELRPR